MCTWVQAIKEIKLLNNDYGALTDDFHPNQALTRQYSELKTMEFSNIFKVSCYEDLVKIHFWKLN